MVWDILGSVLLGFGLSWTAARRLAHRLPSRRVVLLAGTFGALFGFYLTHMALGPGHVLAEFVGAVAVSMVLLSLLLRPSGHRLHGVLPH